MAAPVFLHVTHPKCGSQWVRNVLTAPEVARHSGATYAGKWLRFPDEAMPRGDGPTLYSPDFYVLAREWRRFRGPQDKAIVVQRDPRDLIISWMYSMVYSHPREPGVDNLRMILRALSPRLRLRLGLFWFNDHGGHFRDFVDCKDENLYHTSYEKLTTDEQGEFRRIVDFFGWPVPEEDLRAAVSRHSFATQTGRAKGDVDDHSHLRSGQPGEWRSHFLREHGEILEIDYPNLVADAGYEPSSDWVKDLPETLPMYEDEAAGGAASAEAESRIADLLTENTRLKEQARMLEQVCQERLELIERLDAECRGLNERIHGRAAQRR